MTALAAILPLGAPSPPADSRGWTNDARPGARERVVSGMLAAMPERGDREPHIRGSGPVALGATAHASAGGGPVVLAEDDVVVAADATLYYRDDLEGRLESAGSSARGASAAHLVLAAYRAWGADCARHLEGDFAFVLWDGARGIGLAARDFSGVRSLYWAELGDRVALASTSVGILAHPESAGELNLAVVGEVAAGLWGSAEETAHLGVHRVRPGTTLVIADGRVERRRHWESPVPRVDRGTPFAEAAEELRRLLVAATAERLAPGGTTSVWMSGGRDSTAVFAAGMTALASGARSGALRPVSISYPPGDPGREDETIEAVAGAFDVPVRWIDIADIPFLEAPGARAARRPEPFGHFYENWLRALARASVEMGAGVALGGYGGDQLFQSTDAFFADLLARGRWLAFAREWRARPELGRHHLYTWAIRPLLPRTLRRAIASRRHWLPGYDVLERPIPPWIRPDFVADHDLEARAAPGIPPALAGGRAGHEFRFYLESPYFSNIASLVYDIALEQGVEVRSPLYDARVVALAATRPREERNGAGENKRLLREASRGWIPDAILEHRPTKTGLTSGYFERSTRLDHADFIESSFQRPCLAEAGIVDPDRLQGAWRAYRRHGGEELGGCLMHTLQAELWLSARLTAPGVYDVEATRARHSTGERPATPDQRLLCMRSHG